MLGLLLGWSGLALAQSAQLYELTENMKLVSKGQPRRTATSELMGFADVGTPLCPSAVFAGGGTRCTINATGSDNVSLVTGLGTLSGRFAVVVQGDNPVDSPEFVVMRGNFRGKIDFGFVLTAGFGTVTGTFTSDAGQRIPFSGTFRVPFAIDVTTGQKCLPSAANPACVPMYTNLDPTVPSPVVPVQPNEYSLGYPTVRFDIQF
jgi:hypothetical protein